MATDPTRTTVLRQQYYAALRRRFRTLQQQALQGLLNRDFFQLDGPLPSGSIEAQAGAFADLIESLVDRRLLEIVDAEGTPILPFGTEWQEPFVSEGYARGVRRGQVLTQAARGSSVPISLEGPVAVTRIQELFVNNFEDLESIGDDLVADLREELVVGLVEGEGSEAIARRITNRIGIIDRTQARVLARTKIVEAHAEGTLDSFQQQGIRVLVPQVEFTTAGDVRVCVECLGIASRDAFGLGPGVFTIEQARGIIPVHAQCRCAWLPAGVGEDPDERLVRAARQQRRIDELQNNPDARRRQREASERRNRRTRPVEVL